MDNRLQEFQPQPQRRGIAPFSKGAKDMFMGDHSSLISERFPLGSVGEGRVVIARIGEPLPENKDTTAFTLTAGGSIQMGKMREFLKKGMGQVRIEVLGTKNPSQAINANFWIENPDEDQLSERVTSGIAFDEKGHGWSFVIVERGNETGLLMLPGDKDFLQQLRVSVSSVTDLNHKESQGGEVE